MVVLLPVVLAHSGRSPLLDQQYSYAMIDPLLISGGPHATKITGGVIDTVCTDIESRRICAGAVIMEKLY